MNTFDLVILSVFSGAFGAVIGAYFSTVEYRIHVGTPLITSKCYCPVCGHELPLHHQIPIISWFVLKGRCYYCQASISVRYPLIEGGFLLYYIVGFFLLHRRPFILISAWYLFTILILFLRCHGHWRGLVKGSLIMLALHLLFCPLIALILSII